MTRRLTLLLLSTLLAAPAPALACGRVVAPTATVLAAPQPLLIPASNGRQVRLSVWRTEAKPERGVLIFGHGMGGEPMAYAPFLAAMLRAGYDVVAPLAVDSLGHPDRAQFDLPAGFGARVEDMMVARGYAFQAFPGIPQVLAGHSYGSLIAMIGAGAKSPAGPLAGPPVAGVLALSSPGIIPGLVSRDAFASLDAPLLMVTGSKDVVPGFVKNPADHRLAYETAPKGRNMILTVKGGDHDFMIRGNAVDRDDVTHRIVEWLAGVTARADVPPLPAMGCEWDADNPPPYREEHR